MNRLQRRTPLRSDPATTRDWQRRSKPLARTTRLRPLGEVRRRMRRLGEVDGPVCEVARMSRCALTGAEPRPRNHPHHTGRTRRDWTRSGECLVVPLAPDVHRDYHDLPRAQWRAKYGTEKPGRPEMRELARWFGEKWMEGR